GQGGAGIGHRTQREGKGFAREDGADSGEEAGAQLVRSGVEDAGCGEDIVWTGWSEPAEGIIPGTAERVLERGAHSAALLGHLAHPWLGMLGMHLLLLERLAAAPGEWLVGGVWFRPEQLGHPALPPGACF